MPNFEREISSPLLLGVLRLIKGLFYQGNAKNRSYILFMTCYCLAKIEWFCGFKNCAMYGMVNVLEYAIKFEDYGTIVDLSKLIAIRNYELGNTIEFNRYKNLMEEYIPKLSIINLIEEYGITRDSDKEPVESLYYNHKEENKDNKEELVAHIKFFELTADHKYYESEAYLDSIILETSYTPDNDLDLEELYKILALGYREQGKFQRAKEYEMLLYEHAKLSILNPLV